MPSAIGTISAEENDRNSGSNGASIPAWSTSGSNVYSWLVLWIGPFMSKRWQACQRVARADPSPLGPAAPPESRLHDPGGDAYAPVCPVDYCAQLPESRHCTVIAKGMVK